MIKFLIDIAVVHTLFYFIWQFVFTLPIVVIATFLKIDIWGIRLSKGLGAIVFSSLSSIVVLNHYTGIATLIIYSLIAGILLLFNLISAYTEALKNARQELDMWVRIKMENALTYNYVYWLIAIIFFILTLFFPIIGINPINRIFVFLMDWLMNIKIINWIVMGLSFFFLISFIWKGIFGLIMLIALRKNSNDEE